MFVFDIRKVRRESYSFDKKQLRAQLRGELEAAAKRERGIEDAEDLSWKFLEDPQRQRRGG